MNTSIIDPLQGDVPEVIEEYLEHGIMKCMAFNRRGTLLAAGCNDGSCVIWDFETRGIAKELRDNECCSPITIICWSKCGNRILVTAADKSLSLWDVMSGKRITRIVLQQTPLLARLHPGSFKPSLCLVCPLSCTPMIVDLNTENTTYLQVSVSEKPIGPNPASRNKCSDGSTSFTPTAACFSKYGNLVYVGNSKGEILVIDSKDGKVRAMVPIFGGSVVKNIVFSRKGQYLLTNSNDRVIRIYENLLPPKDEVRALDELNENLGDLDGVEKLKAVGTKCLTLFREIQDAITKVHWQAPCFSGDGEWVVGGSAGKGEHKIYIWDRAGDLVKILEGPKEALIDLAWHPVRPIVISLTLNGIVYIWAKDYIEYWSAFAPDFKEIEENEEYVEREDEFDLNPETVKVKGSDVNEDEEMDIMTVEKDLAFSDSDMSQEELCFLPASPCRDVPEQEHKFLESVSYMGDSNNSGSPFLEEVVTNGHMMTHASSPVEGFSLNDFPLHSIMAAAKTDIHEDIALSILSKLPIKSLTRFTCAKKSWPLLFENPLFMNMFRSNFFISKHDDKNKDSAAHLFIIEHSGFPVQQSLCILSGERFENKVSLDWPPPFQKDDYNAALGLPISYKILGSASVNGTLCLYRGCHNEFKIVLWNPATADFKIIPPSFQPYENIEFDYPPCGFGYDCVTDDYKVIRKVYYSLEFEGGHWVNLPNTGDPFWEIDVHELDTNDHYWEDKKLVVKLYEPFWEIYSLKSNSWRKLDGVDDMPVSYSGPMSLVNLNGFSHWLTQEPDMMLFDFGHWLTQGPDMVSFDFSKETFFTTTLPSNSDIMHEYTTINLVELNDSLSVITSYDREPYFDVWILGELGVKESWTKFFVVGPLACYIISPILVGNKNRIFFTDENSELGWLDFSTQRIEKIEVKGKSFPAQMAVYKENLLPFGGMNG